MNAPCMPAGGCDNQVGSLYSGCFSHDQPRRCDVDRTPSRLAVRSRRDASPNEEPRTAKRRGASNCITSTPRPYARNGPRNRKTPAGEVKYPPLAEYRVASPFLHLLFLHFLFFTSLPSFLTRQLAPFDSNTPTRPSPFLPPPFPHPPAKPAICSRTFSTSRKASPSNDLRKTQNRNRPFFRLKWLEFAINKKVLSHCSVGRCE